ncbi:MFS transporter [Paraburkholderia sp. D15]|uniref:MFS transporter n=1 Tax=Paraburkholderia sp. D15 TaxID=2880218 RepID=UPI00247AC2F4|nr:MFS transporter [Paraburkholderia sp. D15]WGS52351.1 MFS transporter [Paraburkholderia sp. D15]
MLESLAKEGDYASTPEIENSTYRRVTTRLVPILFLAYVFSYLDRVNVGFAKLQMLSDLNLSEAVYGLGAGIFFIGYALFEIPSNILLHKFGARRWIARIMITWGVLAAAMIFVKSPGSFYVLRFLLGVAEAGFQPGIVLYLTFWYPERRRGQIMALFFAAVPASSILGGPLSGWIMSSFTGVHGLAGWQWMFVIEALPAIAIGLVILCTLPDSIGKASWLSKTEATYLERAINQEARKAHEFSLKGVFSNPMVLVMAAIYFCNVIGIYGISFWLPTIIKSTGITNLLDIGLLTAAPSLAAIVFMIYISRKADRTGERKRYLAIMIAIGSLGLAASVLFSSNTTLSLLSLAVATVGMYSALPLFWSLPTAYLSGVAAAAGIALINSLANVSGFVGPYLIGWVKQTTGSTNMAIIALSVASALGFVLVLSIPSKIVNRVPSSRVEG